MDEDVNNPAVCTVHLNKVQTIIGYFVFLLVLTIFAWMVQRFSRVPVAYEYGLGIAILTFLGVTFQAFRHWNKPCYQADGAGVYNGWSRQTIPWEDVVAVECFDHPRPEPDTRYFSYLSQERWSVVLTVRQPRKYLTGLRQLLYTPKPAATGEETAQVWLEFGGIQPRSRELYHCIQHHLARQKRLGSSGT